MLLKFKKIFRALIFLSVSALVYFVGFVSTLLIFLSVFPEDPVTGTSTMPLRFLIFIFLCPAVVVHLIKSPLRRELDEFIPLPAPTVQPQHYAAKGFSVEPCPVPEVPVEEPRPIPEVPAEEPRQEQDPLDIIREMEQRFSDMYRFAYDHMLNAADCKRAYSALLKNYDYATLPLAAQVRLEQLCDEYKDKFDAPNPLGLVDAMSGPDFERWVARLLEGTGFADVLVTPEIGDQGVDIIAVKDGIRYAFQCKRYASDLGNTPVQEVYAGKEVYGCQVAVVVTNQHFTVGAKELAEKTRVLLWDRERLSELISAYSEPSAAD